MRVKLTLSYAGFLVVAGTSRLSPSGIPAAAVRARGQTSSSSPADPALDRHPQLCSKCSSRYAWWALGAAVVFGLVGGWCSPASMLRPLDRITDAARKRRDGDVDHRIALPGPRDELTDLADAFDAMLARVQHTLDEERRFAANASHEYNSMN